MDNIREFKEAQINSYLSSVDGDAINANIIKEDLQRLIGEKPAVWFNYKQETLVTEDGSRTKKLEKLESVTITFTYETIIDGKLIPVPVKKTYIIG